MTLHILLLYSSRFGYTKKIADTLATQWQQAGHRATLRNLDDAAEAALPADGFHAIVIGASIRYGHYSPALARWAAQNLHTLQRVPSGFFSVSILANKPHRSTPQTHTYTRKFFAASAWRPQHIGIFAGELDYSKYHIVDRYLMKLVMWLNRGETDFKAHIEFTDWNAVRDFGNDILAIASAGLPEHSGA